MWEHSVGNVCIPVSEYYSEGRDPGAPRAAFQKHRAHTFVQAKGCCQPCIHSNRRSYRTDVFQNRSDVSAATQTLNPLINSWTILYDISWSGFDVIMRWLQCKYGGTPCVNNEHFKWLHGFCICLLNNSGKGFVRAHVLIIFFSVGLTLSGSH